MFKILKENDETCGIDDDNLQTIRENIVECDSDMLEYCEDITIKHLDNSLTKQTIFECLEEDFKKDSLQSEVLNCYMEDFDITEQELKEEITLTMILAYYSYFYDFYIFENRIYKNVCHKPIRLLLK